MRLTRHRNQNRTKAPQIAISQAEITADLIYPARPRHVPAGERRARDGRR
jgi:hypothetical protein